MSRVMVGAQILCFINGQLLGEVTGHKFSSSTPHTERRGIDSLIGYELSPVGAKVSGSFSILKLSMNGGLEGKGIVAPFTHLSREKYFSILIKDRKTDTTVFQADYCKVTDQTWSMVAKSRVEGSFAYEGLVWNNDVQY